MPKFILLVYTDPQILGAIPQPQFDSMMKGCIEKADDMKSEGRLLQSEQLEAPETARTVRLRDGRVSTFDGPFAEAKEVLGGFNIVEAANIEEATRMAHEFPWIGTGSIEVRPVKDFEAVRQRVGA